MGLDAVEIIMALEDEFGISIKDEDVADVRTVGELYDVVMAKIGHVREDDACMTARVFYRLRRGLQEVTGLERRAITPTTSLAAMLPAAARPKTWRTWAIRAGMRFPDLCLSPRLGEAQGLACLVGLLLAGGLGWFLHSIGVPMFATGLLCGAAWIALAVGLHEFTSRHAATLPTHLHTLGDLTHELVHQGIPTHPSVRKDRGLMTPETVWNRVVDLTARIATVPRDRIIPTAEFGKDLGL